ncbi:hypothetical protein Hanom_Chr03g00264011 [Helianthus anomalus]
MANLQDAYWWIISCDIWPMGVWAFVVQAHFFSLHCCCCCCAAEMTPPSSVAPSCLQIMNPKSDPSVLAPLSLVVSAYIHQST